MNKRTIIVAVAMSIPADQTYTKEELDAVVNPYGDDYQLVGVLDRDKPELSIEPQIFAAYAEEQLEEKMYGDKG